MSCRQRPSAAIARPPVLQGLVAIRSLPYRCLALLSLAILLVPSGQAQPPPLPPPEPTTLPQRTPRLPAKRLISGLIAGLADHDSEVRQNLGLALASLGSDAVPPLIEALKDSRSIVRGAAAYALGQMGATAEPALESLLGLLQDGDTEVRRKTSYALSRILAASRRSVDRRDPLVSPLATPAGNGGSSP